MNHIDWQLLHEYGLNQPNYQLLRFIEQQGGEAHWEVLRATDISGQPALALRNLVEQGLLDGPRRLREGTQVKLEPIGSKPFRLTEKGRDVAGRCARGLHKPSWLTEYRIHALKTLVEQGGTVTEKERLALKVKKNTLTSLLCHRYVTHDQDTWSITDVGREAWSEYLEDPTPIITA